MVFGFNCPTGSSGGQRASTGGSGAAIAAVPLLPLQPQPPAASGGFNAGVAAAESRPVCAELSAAAAAADTATAAHPPAGAIAASPASVSDVPQHHFKPLEAGTDETSATAAGRPSGSRILTQSLNSVTD